jgi:hypothetical protein
MGVYEKNLIAIVTPTKSSQSWFAFKKVAVSKEIAGLLYKPSRLSIPSQIVITIFFSAKA